MSFFGSGGRLDDAAEAAPASHLERSPTAFLHRGTRAPACASPNCPTCHPAACDPPLPHNHTAVTWSPNQPVKDLPVPLPPLAIDCATKKMLVVEASLDVNGFVNDPVVLNNAAAAGRAPPLPVDRLADASQLHRLLHVDIPTHEIFSRLKPRERHGCHIFPVRIDVRATGTFLPTPLGVQLCSYTSTDDDSDAVHAWLPEDTFMAGSSRTDGTGDGFVIPAGNSHDTDWETRMTLGEFDDALLRFAAADIKALRHQVQNMQNTRLAFAQVAPSAEGQAADDTPKLRVENLLHYLALRLELPFEEGAHSIYIGPEQKVQMLEALDTLEKQMQASFHFLSLKDDRHDSTMFVRFHSPFPERLVSETALQFTQATVRFRITYFELPA